GLLAVVRLLIVLFFVRLLLVDLLLFDFLLGLGGEQVLRTARALLQLRLHELGVDLPVALAPVALLGAFADRADLLALAVGALLRLALEDEVALAPAVVALAVGHLVHPLAGAAVARAPARAA